MITVHYQFTEADCIELHSNIHPTCGPLVSLQRHAGSMHLQFDMTPAQAREMAEALVLHADGLEVLK